MHTPRQTDLSPPTTPRPQTARTATASEQAARSPLLRALVATYLAPRAAPTEPRQEPDPAA
jgi:hypothetical protein